MPRDLARYNEYHREYQKKRYHRRRAEAYEILGNKCAQCGSVDSLEIDHKRWQDKEIKLNKLWSISKSRFFAELEKCQLLCNSCHIEKSRKDIPAARGYNSTG